MIELLWPQVTPGLSLTPWHMLRSCPNAYGISHMIMMCNKLKNFSNENNTLTPVTQGDPKLTFDTIIFIVEGLKVMNIHKVFVFLR